MNYLHSAATVSFLRHGEQHWLVGVPDDDVVALLKVVLVGHLHIILAVTFRKRG